MSSPCCDCRNCIIEYTPATYDSPEEYDAYCSEDMASFDMEKGEGCWNYDYENKEDKEDCDPDYEYEKWKDGL